MAVMVTGDDLRSAVEKQTFIKDGAPDHAEGVKYDFRFHHRILKAKNRVPKDMGDGEVVEPGEVVFVLTQESLELPNNMVAQLSPKRSLSHAGIMTIGGSTIDPGYRGRLLIGLYNFSSTPYSIRPLNKVIAATFYMLDDDEAKALGPPVGKSLTDFPDELVQVMSKYEPMAIKTVAEAVSSVRRELAELRLEFRNHEQWYDRFRGLVEDNSRQIKELTTNLTSETQNRKAGEDKFSDAIQQLERTFTFLRWTAIVVGGLVTAVAVPLLVSWLQELLGIGAG